MDNEDIVIHNFDSGNNYKNTGQIYLLKLLIHTCTGNWIESLSITKDNIMLDNNAEIFNYFLLSSNTFILIYTTKSF